MKKPGGLSLPVLLCIPSVRLRHGASHFFFPDSSISLKSISIATCSV